MKVFTAPTRDERGKFIEVVRACPEEIWSGTILDVGCRSTNFKKALPDGVSYWGVDLFLPASIIGDAQALPFTDKSFDVVVTLDVLEHTDNIHGAFAEVCRVARGFIVITLPNMYEVKNRIKFLFGKRLSGKYELTPKPPGDRHRWFSSLNNARIFVSELGKEYGFERFAEGTLVGPRRKRWIGLAVRLFPNIFAPTYLAILQRERGEK